MTSNIYRKKYALPINGRLERTLIFILERGGKGLPFPGVDDFVGQPDHDGVPIAINRGVSATRLRRLEELELIEREGHEWSSGSFTELGAAIATLAFQRGREGKLLHLKTAHKNVNPKWNPLQDGGYSVHRTMVRDVLDIPRHGEKILKSGLGVAKLGPKVTKGRLKGAPIVYLTLEERYTCPPPQPDGTGCQVWRECYGNNMRRSVRYKPGDNLVRRIDYELSMHERNVGGPLLVRLHELGDFYSTDYVKSWWCQLRLRPWLHIFGFTAHDPTSEIGRAIDDVQHEFGQRFSMRWSGYPGPMGAVVQRKGERRHPDAFQCPEQLGRVNATGKILNCGSCGACWSTKKAVSFKEH